MPNSPSKRGSRGLGLGWGLLDTPSLLGPLPPLGLGEKLPGSGGNAEVREATGDGGGEVGPAPVRGSWAQESQPVTFSLSYNLQGEPCAQLHS